ncbi:MAG TPA: type II toxin-antitoxin system RelE/ParE family toxin [Pirellulales bacterium]|nr:type II toxin-antitoxin system RelE/ParE family toxin [Pirellulales bacterium]
MSRYTVVWWPRAEADLAEIWTTTKDRASVSAAANQIDQRLARKPRVWGQQLRDSRFRAEIGTLRVYYRVSDDDRRVEVVGIAEIHEDD